jgi:hypothetical protein
MFEERENPNPDEAIDPPDNQGGGGAPEPDLEPTDAAAIDPPDHGGGGGN